MSVKFMKRNPELFKQLIQVMTELSHMGLIWPGSIRRVLEDIANILKDTIERHNRNPIPKIMVPAAFIIALTKNKMIKTSSIKFMKFMTTTGFLNIKIKEMIKDISKAEKEKPSWFIKSGNTFKTCLIIPPECQKTYNLRGSGTIQVRDARYQTPFILGEGGSGVVFDVCDKLKKCKYIMKIQLIESVNQSNNFKKELDYSTIFSKNKISPHLYNGWICTGFSKRKIPVHIGILVYEKWDGELLQNDILSKNILLKWKRMLKVIHKAGYIHADLYPKNLLVKRNCTGQVIDISITDFGLSDTIENFKGKEAKWLNRLCIHLSIWDNPDYLPGIKKIFYEMTDTDNLKDACRVLTVNPILFDWVVYQYYVKYKSV